MYECYVYTSVGHGIATGDWVTMEMNKGEAEKCRDIAKKFLRDGKYRQAIKFFEKSHRMFPLPGVEAMCERARCELAKEEGRSSNASASSAPAPNVRRRESSNTSADESLRPYTEEQVQIVNKICACKNHYDVLGLRKNAEENEIKKAYRKVLLNTLLHESLLTL